MRKHALKILFLFFALFLLSVGGAGEMLIRPSHRGPGDPPKDLTVESVKFGSAVHDTIAGWLVRGEPGKGVVLLVHGVRSSRQSMIGRAKFLHRLGYSVLLIDLPAHGESTGAHITYGINEGEGVKAALGFLRQQFPREKIGVIGTSLGAASLVLAKPDPAPNAVILESMFPTIRDALKDRLDAYLGPVGEPLAPVLLYQLPLRLGIAPDQLRPIADIGSLKAPVFIISGSKDERTTLPETRKIFEAAHSPKDLWVVEGAGHVNLYRFQPKEYEAKVSAFLAKYLR
jgi:pimeloyl-ACP methyl ester carboxylesterase